MSKTNIQIYHFPIFLKVLSILYLKNIIDFLKIYLYIFKNAYFFHSILKQNFIHFSLKYIFIYSKIF